MELVNLVVEIAKRMIAYIIRHHWGLFVGSEILVVIIHELPPYGYTDTDADIMGFVLAILVFFVMVASEEFKLDRFMEETKLAEL